MPALAASVPLARQVDRIEIGGHTLHFSRPSCPEALLDLPEVAAAYAADEYMPYWATVWPAAHCLMEVLSRTQLPAGRAIELGCGLGLPGILAMRLGMDVLLTDYDATAVDFAVRSAELNGFPAARGLAIDWRCPPAERFDLILASDLLYEQRNIAPLVAAFLALLAPGGLVLSADPDRVYAPAFQAALAAAGFTTVCEKLAAPGGGTVTVYCSRLAPQGV